MKCIVFPCLALSLGLGLAVPARAADVDLSVNACPGNVGASADAGALDCAGGQQLVLLATFVMPAREAIASVQLSILITAAGDVATDATFWDFDDANHAGWRAFKERPATGCSNYTDAWSGPNTGVIWGGTYHGGGQASLVVIAYRRDDLAVDAGERVFGAQIAIFGATSADAGGSGAGCTKGACVAVTQATLDGVSAGPTAGVFGNEVTINGLPPSSCQLVPARRATWGQLKALYR